MMTTSNPVPIYNFVCWGTLKHSSAMQLSSIYNIIQFYPLIHMALQYICLLHVLVFFQMCSVLTLSILLCMYFPDIDECEKPEAYSCYGICQNFLGTFQCQCPNGTYGSPSTKDGCVVTTKQKNSYTGDKPVYVDAAYYLIFFIL